VLSNQGIYRLRKILTILTKNTEDPTKSLTKKTIILPDKVWVFGNIDNTVFSVSGFFNIYNKTLTILKNKCINVKKSLFGRINRFQQDEELFKSSLTNFKTIPYYENPVGMLRDSKASKYRHRFSKRIKQMRLFNYAS
jgi:hypothetical protein